MKTAAKPTTTQTHLGMGGKNSALKRTSALRSAGARDMQPRIKGSKSPPHKKARWRGRVREKYERRVLETRKIEK
jgi:hypothetical protein